MKQQLCFHFVLFLLFISFHGHCSSSSSAMSNGQSLFGNQTLISPGEIFELGFFTPGKSGKYYLGIWYKSPPGRTVIWVANREDPVSNLSSSAVEFTENGNLVLYNQSDNVIWSSNSTSSTPNSTVLELLDSGNLVIADVLDSSNVLWQSFDYPTDHWIPGSKVGYNKLKKTKQILRPWRSPDNPAPGPWSNELDPNGTSQLLLWNGSEIYWSSGEWTGQIFLGVPEILRNYYVRNMTYVSNENESYFTYSAAIPSALTRFVFDVTGQLRQYVWRKNFDGWALFWTRPGQQCEVYAFCGAFGSCNQLSEPLCQCMGGFEPKVPEDWEQQDHSSGCARKSTLKCDVGEEDSFLVISNVRFPANSESSTAGSIEDCKAACLSNCSCTGFAYNGGCLHWKGDLYNLQQLSSNDDGKNFYLRLAAVSVPEPSGGKTPAVKKTIWIAIVVVSGFLLLTALVVLLMMRKRMDSLVSMEDSLTVFKYRDIQRATRNFSDKLGEGAFGSVYRGTLPDSTVIAAKRLKSLEQGENQFRMELRTIGIIQHVNLVRLRGFCVESSKRILVFDFMPNGSLQSALFQIGNANILDWRTRYNIAIGTAKGLAYLHDGCSDLIIHCDIKPENILLDSEFNPKVADFGLAKLIGREFSRVLTTMRGTRGYLAPEWISGNAITPKADVFSYGMLLFEIISGRRNSESLDDGTDDYFPLRVANVLSRKAEDVNLLLDKRLEGNADMEELSRACRVACWCIQDNEKDRPTMGQVVQILEGVVEVGTPPIPQLLQCLMDDPVEIDDKL